MYSAKTMVGHQGEVWKGMVGVKNEILLGGTTIPWEATDFKIGVSDGDRTHDHWSHNPALYQLSYTHR